MLLAKALGWDRTKLEVQPIAAGLTNKNYRLTRGDKVFFFRLPGPSTELLAVDRANELHNTRAAAKAGVGPKVLQHDAKTGAMLLEWIPDERCRTRRSRHRACRRASPDALRRLHAGPRFRDDFDMFRLAEYYLRVVDERSIRVPDGYRDALPKVALIEAALAAQPLPTVPCHNDLLAENYLDDGRALWIVDYEYSGNNDPTFELGNTAQELGFDAARQEELCAAYFGPERFAREGRPSSPGCGSR